VEKTMYVNGHLFGNGDYHFVMSSSQARKFQGLYDWLSLTHKYYPHQTIKRYLTEVVHLPLEPDSIRPYFHQECIRNIHPFELRKFMSYGITDSDLQKTVVDRYAIRNFLILFAVGIALFLFMRYRTVTHPLLLFSLSIIPIFYLIYYHFGPFRGTISYLVFALLLLLGCMLIKPTQR